MEANMLFSKECMVSFKNVSVALRENVFILWCEHHT